jgi:hypothetical protein
VESGPDWPGADGAGDEGSVGDVVRAGLDGAGAGELGGGLAGEGVCEGAGVRSDGAGEGNVGDDVGAGDDGGFGE